VKAGLWARVESGKWRVERKWKATPMPFVVGKAGLKLEPPLVASNSGQRARNLLFSCELGFEA
jgi:hypothetical protein